MDEEKIENENTSKESIENSAEKESNYAILGLPDDAPDNVVKNKYGALLRQYKQRTDEYGVTDADVEYYERITKAYDEIMGITHDFSAYNPSSPVPYKIQKIWAKICAFFDQYNILIICVVLVIVGGVIFFFQYRSNGKEDITIKFVGAYASASGKNLKTSIDDKSETVENAQISFYTVTTTTTYDNNSQSQASAFLSQVITGNLDVVLIDKESFDVYVKEKTFMKLDEYVNDYYEEYGTDKKLEVYEYELIPTKEDEHEIEKGIYGIDITDSKFFEGMDFAWLYDESKGQEKTMIFAICHKAKHVEKAEKFGIELLNAIE